MSTSSTISNRSFKYYIFQGVTCMVGIFVIYWFLNNFDFFQMPAVKIFQEGGWCAPNKSLNAYCAMIPVKDTWKTILFNVLLYATIGIFIGILRKISSDLFGNILLLILVSTSLLLPPISSFLHLDYSKMTIDDCDKTLYKIKNGYEQSSCYQYTLNYNKNPQLCRILDNSEKLYECYLMTARNLLDVQVCAQIFTEAKRDDCFDIFSRNERNKESCLFIENTEQKNECLEDVEWLQQ